DEHDRGESLPDFVKHSTDPLLLEVSGRMSIRELNHQFNELKLSEDDADTVGGYAFGLFGRIPSVGESYTDENGIKFEITATEGNVITSLFIKLPVTPKVET
ncbi:hypothetical protein F4Y59_01800, partial [Candidatus Poribacteria bacterium]|nr:hypothetical protein [Candidatus Poribacteria bacterium]